MLSFSQCSQIVVVEASFHRGRGSNLFGCPLGPALSFGILLPILLVLASLAAQMVKNLPAMQETWVRSLGQEDPLEKEIAITLVVLPGKSHGQRSLERYSP